MFNVRLVLEYDGSRFHGWQKQPNVRTIEEELLAVLRTVLREDIPSVQAAGRTDAGVHARGQVVNFMCQHEPDLRRLAQSVSSIMREELAVVCAELVPLEFNSRRSALKKDYVYVLFNRETPPILDRGRVWFVSGNLNIPLMCAEAKSLEGEHDFSSLQDSECQAKNPVRSIFSSVIEVNAPYLTYRVCGDGFLKQMVRNIIGTLVYQGQGRINKSLLEILAEKDRRAAGPTAPAHGLTLEKVYYP